MYVVLRGSVTLIKKDHQLEVELPLVTYKTGDCFGDLSIQSSDVSAYDMLSKNLIYAKADKLEGPCHVFRFEREQLIEALFKEMK